LAQEKKPLIHWADMTADRIIRQFQDKDDYTLASGITPSGIVHFGNFRETITTDLVRRALMERGKSVRSIFSWDDFDTFRKIPPNLPQQEMLKDYLFQPIVEIPDPFEKSSNYASYQEGEYERQLALVGVLVEPVYQASKYKAGDYTESIIKTLKNRDVIAGILNKHRTTPLPESWWPVSLYCEKCNRDKMEKIHFDGDHSLEYTCELCGHSGIEDVVGSQKIKLPWRVDWPMRWKYESVDFEPGGKDHSSEGGSFTTAKEIVKDVFEGTAPMYLQYDFVAIKGQGGKMSSSKGNTITVDSILEIYSATMLRWIFASYKPNVDFGISFDIDVIKTYEDFDRQEKLAYGIVQGNAKKMAMAKRVFELAQVEGGQLGETPPFRAPFRHLCNVLQINDGNIEKAKEYYANDIKNEIDEASFTQRAQKAWFWIKNYAPEDFKYQINSQVPQIDLTAKEKDFLSDLASYLETSWDQIESDKALNDTIYQIIHKFELEPKDVFFKMYQILINREKGPKLASFIRSIGKDKILNLIK
jgi:lysyl-tRNA synthetase, class I